MLTRPASFLLEVRSSSITYGTDLDSIGMMYSIGFFVALYDFKVGRSNVCRCIIGGSILILYVGGKLCIYASAVVPLRLLCLYMDRVQPTTTSRCGREMVLTQADMISYISDMYNLKAIDWAFKDCPADPKPNPNPCEGSERTNTASNWKPGTIQTMCIKWRPSTTIVACVKLYLVRKIATRCYYS